MNSSSRSHCSCCQSWDNKGPFCVADLKGEGSLLSGIPWLPWGNTPATQAGNTAAGVHHFIREKRGQFHVNRKVCLQTLWPTHRLQTLQHQFQTPVRITGKTEQWRTKPQAFQNVHCTNYTPHYVRNGSSQSETTTWCYLQTSFVLMVYEQEHFLPSIFAFLSLLCIICAKTQMTKQHSEEVPTEHIFCLQLGRNLLRIEWWLLKEPLLPSLDS